MQGKTFETFIWGVSAIFVLLLFAGQDARADTGQTVLDHAQNPFLYAGILVSLYVAIKLIGAPRGQL